ncbi:conserved hypothetical protein [Theileria equi strain WA]|uniref:B30.2/SPRY domain-containing protein n=1 Tax=Theileria equi strain WA TaxID=1537102 RepID=L1LC10_THEEQ|nr:conserved hypothetical protein [Theileria equi strain WA]EKX72809.1 conserved hypothetical protein [Theileria equi strain WA]|eukprot:XP_004832261.1 conserved hypothetical protein [Theileria equi strain WA]
MFLNEKAPFGNSSPVSRLKRTYILAPVDNKNKSSDDDVVPKLSVKYKDRNIKLSSDRLTATGYKGWTSVFSTHCSSAGKWYYEVNINADSKNLRFVGYEYPMKPNIKGHVRIGYACRYQRYDMPVGVNNFGFSLSDVDGKIVHDKQKHDYAVSYGTGDTIGCFISLETPTTHFTDPSDDIKLYEFIRNGMLCDPRNIPKSDSNSDSYVQFSINGEIYPKCNLKVYDGYYHPAISLYMGASVTVNLGKNVAEYMLLVYTL